MTSLRARIGWRLRCWADRIDREHAFVAFGGYWNHTPSGIKVTVTDGIQVNPPVPGVPLWYASDAYDDAWTQPNALGHLSRSCVDGDVPGEDCDCLADCQ